MISSIFTDTQWLRSEHALSTWQLARPLDEWLTDPGSLTVRLQSAWTNFHVEVLQHCASTVSNDELQFMQQQNHLNCQVREVLLCEQQTPHVFARSVIPEASKGLLHELQHIGSNPLGQALFTHAGVFPDAFQFAVFAPASKMGQLNTRLTGRTQTIYGRRRIFWVAKSPVLVAEVFLSGAPCYNLLSD